MNQEMAAGPDEPAQVADERQRIRHVLQHVEADDDVERPGLEGRKGAAPFHVHPGPFAERERELAAALGHLEVRHVMTGLRQVRAIRTTRGGGRSALARARRTFVPGERISVTIRSRTSGAGEPVIVATRSIKNRKSSSTERRASGTLVTDCP